MEEIRPPPQLPLLLSKVFARKVEQLELSNAFSAHFSSCCIITANKVNRPAVINQRCFCDFIIIIIIITRESFTE